ncbi:MAG: phage terminase large subunit family protein [Fulvimarina manganoxydans]|uniref:phage terminase large subunit family protein n=1 Tax=Fulvimarina manganoxydans TaxID=937218 RepID=UPI0023543122|nr:phage terminase large subunit family protein [Fulvimarina manganoxydans]MCK5932925.1 phage terminase large subunit family protein [Fulvimarina manganoxydans]
MLMTPEETAAWAEAIHCDGLMPSPSMTVSAWAEAHRVLPSTVARPGPWRTERTPYLRDVMDCLSEDSPFERVVLMAGSQVGKTEAGLNWLGYVIDHAPGVALLVMPALSDTKRNVRVRIDPMIASSPRLRGRIGPARSRDGSNSLFRKVFPGGELIMTGANAASSLRSTPVRYLFLDEVDAYPGNVDDEGDVVDLAIRRTSTFRSQRKIFLSSTPKLAGASRINLAFQQSDQRRLFVPCFQCGDYAPVTWSRIRWPKGERHKAALTCEACGGIAEDREKPRLLAEGEWRATATGDGKTAGFHLPGLLSPFESWADQALQHEQAGNDPVRLQVWVNTVLGETWEDRGGDGLDGDTLATRQESVTETVPAFACVLTGAVDVQGDRLEAKVMAWGPGEEAAVIALQRFPGDPSGPQVWQRLDEWLRREWASERGPSLPLRAVCIDTGGHHTRAAYDFCRPRGYRNVWAIKGHNQPGALPWPRQTPKAAPGAPPLFMVGVNALKDTIAARLSIAEPGPGKVHFTGVVPADYFDQLAAERRLTRHVHGRAIASWEKRPGVHRNEALDLFVYCLAALTGLQQRGLNLDSESDELDRLAVGVLRATQIVRRSKFMAK